VNLASHFIKPRSSVILNCFSGPSLLYYITCWSSGGKEENYRWRRIIEEKKGGEDEKN